MPRVELRPSVAADFLALQGCPPAWRCQCITALVDGRVIGIGGVVHLPNGTHAASVIMNEEARRYPVAIHRAGRAAIAKFRELGLKRVLAFADADTPASERWLERLGFRRLNGVFVWESADALSVD
jgi:RimJ/RimL family protein N-acetyltransferase